MKTILNLIRKYWALIVFAISFVIDTQYGILEKIIEDPFWVNIVRGLGAALLAAVTGKGISSAPKDNVMLDDETDQVEDIGGGGIKNPKP